MAQADQYADARWPEHGLDLAHGFAAQPELTTPVGTNVRTWEPVRGRARGGQRPGLEAHAAGRLPTAGLVQELNAVVWKTPDALPGGCCSLWDDPATTQDTSSLESLYLPFLAGSLGGGDPSTLAVTADPNTGVQVRTGGTGDAPARTTRRVPTLTWTSPGVMVAGNPLSAAQQNATATDPTTGVAVAGTFQYFPVAGTVPDVGVQTLGVLFTPSDTSYCCVTATVSVTVAAAPTPAAAWAVVDPWLAGGSSAAPAAVAAAWAVKPETTWESVPSSAASGATAAWAVVAPTLSITNGVTVGAFTLYQLGTFTDTGTVTSMTIPPITLNAGDLLLLGAAASDNGSGLAGGPASATWNGTVSNKDAFNNIGGGGGGDILSIRAAAGATSSVVVAWADSNRAGSNRVVTVVRVVGTTSAVSDGNGSNRNNAVTTLTTTTSVAVSHTPAFEYSFLGTMGPPADTAASWSEAHAGVTFAYALAAGQRDGTSTGSRDVTGVDAYAATTGTGTYTPTASGFTGRDAVLVSASYR